MACRASKQTDPLVRFIDVVRYFLSGWHIKPKVNDDVIYHADFIFY
jgi:hypothetical protein